MQMLRAQICGAVGARKRFSADTKVTDMQHDCYRTAVAGKDFSQKLKTLRTVIGEIIDGLALDLSWNRI